MAHGGRGSIPGPAMNLFSLFFPRFFAFTSVFCASRGSKMFSSFGKLNSGSTELKIIEIGPPVQKLRVETWDKSKLNLGLLSNQFHAQDLKLCLIIVARFKIWDGESRVGLALQFILIIAHPPGRGQFHCTTELLTPAISPNVGNSGAQFLLVGIKV